MKNPIKVKMSYDICQDWQDRLHKISLLILSKDNNNPKGKVGFKEEVPQHKTLSTEK